MVVDVVVELDQFEGAESVRTDANVTQTGLNQVDALFEPRQLSFEELVSLHDFGQVIISVAHPTKKLIECVSASRRFIERDDHKEFLLHNVGYFHNPLDKTSIGLRLFFQQSTLLAVGVLVNMIQIRFDIHSRGANKNLKWEYECVHERFVPGNDPLLLGFALKVKVDWFNFENGAQAAAFHDDGVIPNLGERQVPLCIGSRRIRPTSNAQFFTEEALVFFFLFCHSVEGGDRSRKNGGSSSSVSVSGSKKPSMLGPSASEMPIVIDPSAILSSASTGPTSSVVLSAVKAAVPGSSALFGVSFLSSMAVRIFTSIPRRGPKVRRAGLSHFSIWRKINFRRLMSFTVTKANAAPMTSGIQAKN